MARRTHLTSLTAAPQSMDFCSKHAAFFHGTCAVCDAIARHPAGKSRGAIRTALDRAADRWVPNLDGTAHAAPSALDTADGVA